MTNVHQIPFQAEPLSRKSHHTVRREAPYGPVWRESALEMNTFSAMNAIPLVKLGRRNGQTRLSGRNACFSVCPKPHPSFTGEGSTAIGEDSTPSVSGASSERLRPRSFAR